MRLIGVFILLLVVSVSCKQKRQEVKTVQVEVDRKNKASTDEIFGPANVVYLETTSGSLLGEISKVILAEEHIYINDKRNGSVVIFDKTGKFLKAIRPTGKGPQEYSQLVGFTINRKNREIILHASRPAKLLFYDLDGKFKYEMPFDELSNGMVADGKELILLNSAVKKGDPYFTFIEYENGQIVDRKFSDFKQNTDLNLYTNGELMMQGERITFVRRFDNTVYSLENKEVYPLYFLDFGAYNCPEGMADFQEDDIRIQERKQEQFFSMKNVKETAGKIFISTNWLGLTVIDKQTGEGHYYSSLLDPELGTMAGSLIPVEDPDNRLFCSEQRVMFLKMELKELSEEFAEKVKNLDLNSNPILLFYECK